MPHKRSFYVVNDENHIATDDNCEGIRFDTREEAEVHAKTLADDCPGHVYEVVSTVSGFVSPIGKTIAVEVIN